MLVITAMSCRSSIFRELVFDTSDVFNRILEYCNNEALLPLILSSRSESASVFEYCNGKITSNPLAFISSVQLLEWSLSMGSPVLSMLSAFQLVAENGDCHVLSRMTDIAEQRAISWKHSKICESAARHGNVEVLKMLLSMSPPCPANFGTCFYTACKGDITTLRWLKSLKNTPFELRPELCSAAAGNGHLSLLKWLRKRLRPPCPWTDSVCTAAALGGHLDIIQWARSQNPPCEWDSSTAGAAACEGRIEVLEWIRSQNPPCPWDSTVLFAAIGDEQNNTPPAFNTDNISTRCPRTHSNIQTMEWLRAQIPPCPWDCELSAAVAASGDLAGLQWLATQSPRCPWDARTCQYAALNGNLDILRWVRSQSPPCPWDESTCAAASMVGDVSVLQWLRTHDPPCPWNINCSTVAAGNGQLAMLRFLRSESPPCPWNPEVCSQSVSSSAYEELTGSENVRDILEIIAVDSGENSEELADFDPPTNNIFESALVSIALNSRKYSKGGLRIPSWMAEPMLIPATIHEFLLTMLYNAI